MVHLLGEGAGGFLAAPRSGFGGLLFHLRLDEWSLVVRSGAVGSLPFLGDGFAHFPEPFGHGPALPSLQPGVQG